MKYKLLIVSLWFCICNTNAQNIDLIYSDDTVYMFFDNASENPYKIQSNYTGKLSSALYNKSDSDGKYSIIKGIKYHQAIIGSLFEVNIRGNDYVAIAYYYPDTDLVTFIVYRITERFKNKYHLKFETMDVSVYSANGAIKATPHIDEVTSHYANDKSLSALMQCNSIEDYLNYLNNATDPNYEPDLQSECV